MKFHLRQREQGSVLVLCLVMCLVIGIAMASFLLLISSRHKMAARSTSWNSAMPVLEAGVEEALTHLTKNPGEPNKDGWAPATFGGQPVIMKQRSLPDGSFYRVAIYDPTSTVPVIYAQGFVPAPLNKNQYISRLVRVDVVPTKGAFVRGITTDDKIRITGNVTIDGYYSSLGGYDTTTNRSAFGDIAAGGNYPGSVDVGNSTVYGKAVTAPEATVVTGPNGSLGDTNWVDGGNLGVQPGWSDNNFNASMPTNEVPSDSYLPPTIISKAGSNIVSLANGSYIMSSLKSTAAKSPVIVSGNAILYVTGDIAVSGTGYILIQAGASLTVYVGGDVSIGGGGVVNENGLASTFSLIGLPTCTSVDIGGTSAFYGTINTPQADVGLNGIPDVFGAVISHTFSSVGVSGFHYDASLSLPGRPIVGDWKEL